MYKKITNETIIREDQWSLWKPNPKKDYNVIAVIFCGAINTLHPNGYEALKNLHEYFPNLVSISVRHFHNAPIELIDNLSKFKNLMYLDLYDTNIIYDLSGTNVIKLLNDCPNLVQVDLSGMLGLGFKLLKNNKISDMCLNEICDIYNGLDETDDNYRYKDDLKKFVNNDDIVIAENYPKIISWNHCRYPRADNL